mmetsp:Transcript_2279/g.4318  ORF Transcript_2279/g.4318 Transcript_2279/m.4318 type:complete len:410 (+) Transcript_2279:81-1310(+)
MKLPSLSFLVPATMLLILGTSNLTMAFQAHLSPSSLTKQTPPVSPPKIMPPIISSLSSSSSQRQRETILHLSSKDDKDSETNMSKRRRRKRKKTTSDGAATAATTKTPETIPSSSSPSASAKSLARELLAQEQIMYDQDEDLTAFIPQKLEEDDRISAAASKAGFAITGGKSEGGIAAEVEDLFDSREFLQRKREKQLEELGQWDSDGGGVPTKKKIKRSDVKAYTRLLEMDPLADEDDSYFEDEEGVDVISALLGDVERGVGSTDVGLQNQERDGSKANAKKKTSFLGIGSGPLQVGHFIGSLGVILMAFVEYPGFPLTNLPDPLRGALQGGLGTIYLINTILAVLAAISAPSRKQPPLLWGAKTFAVGGIAYDQLMQIPTPEELKERERREEEKRTLGRGRGRRNRN